MSDSLGRADHSSSVFPNGFHGREKLLETSDPVRHLKIPEGQVHLPSLPPVPDLRLPFCGKQGRAPCDSAPEHCVFLRKVVASVPTRGQHSLARPECLILLSATRHMKVQRVSSFTDGSLCPGPFASAIMAHAVPEKLVCYESLNATVANYHQPGG